MRRAAVVFAAAAFLLPLRPASAEEKAKEGYVVLTSEEVKFLVDRKEPGTVILDARTPKEYQEVHIQGALSLPDSDLAKDPKLLTWPKETKLVFYCNGVKCGKSKKAALIALEAGYSRVYVYGEGMPVWEEKGYAIYAGPEYEKKVETTKVTPKELAAMVGTKGTTTVVDVRDPKEFGEGHIPGSINIPSEVFASGSGVLEKEKTIVVVCNSGGRSYNAYRKLQKLAYPSIRQGSVTEWKEAGLPLVTE
jgi:rhodanese-related sulfurtransferase